MANGQQPQPMGDLVFNVVPIQIPGPTPAQDSIALMVQIADQAGLSFTMILQQHAARAFREVLNQGLNKAAETLIKPRSALAQA